MIKYLAIVLIGFVFTECIQSQSKSIADNNWISAGVGIGSKKMISNFISYSIIDENTYQISINGNQEFSGFRHGDPNYIISTTFAYGKKLEWSFIFGELFYGPSLVFGKKKGKKIKYTLGVNIDSQIHFSTSDVIGIDIFGNLNFYEPFLGLRIAFFIK